MLQSIENVTELRRFYSPHDVRFDEQLKVVGIYISNGFLLHGKGPAPVCVYLSACAFVINQVLGKQCSLTRRQRCLARRIRDLGLPQLCALRDDCDGYLEFICFKLSTITE